MAWLSGWNRRKSKIINGTDVARLNPIINITVYKGTSTDTLNTVFCGDNVRADFRDLRFTKQDGTTLLKYKLLSFISDVSADVIIEIDFVPPSPSYTEIYMYYDNITAPDTQTSGLMFHTINNINLNDEIGTTIDLTTGIFYNQTFTGTIPYFDEAWVSQKGLIDYSQITNNNYGIGANDIWSLDIFTYSDSVGFGHKIFSIYSSTSSEYSGYP